ncbi:MAG TPA: biotin/lipoyl-containing protein, partial [Casimicrobiaceae bacterium]|nr:biotin/lipoyl-containing protein [Casimicrobiaceae bacterium]
MSALEVKVPDIGDFKDVPVIEVLVKPGDRVAAEDSLVTLESDKATMDVPAPAAGVVRDLNVKVGDKVSEGSMLLTIDTADAGKKSAAPAQAAAPSKSASAAGTGDAAKPQQVPVPAPAPDPDAAAQGGEVVQVKVPDIGDFKDVPVIEVMVKPGDLVNAEDSLVTLESEKATMDVPAPASGRVRELKVKVGDKVSEGSVILALETSKQAGPRPESREAPPPAPPQQNAQPSAPAAKAAPQPAAAPLPPSASPPPDIPPASLIEPEGFRAAHASPSVRKFARELGVDLSKITGTGPKSRILQEDVQKYVKQQLQTARAPSATTAAAVGGLQLLPWPQVDFTKYGAIEEKPLSRIKKISGANLARNWAMIPHVTQFDEADVTDLEALRVAINKENEKQGVKLTMLAFLIKTSVAALQRFPDFNTSLAGENLVYKKYFHIGFAADTPNGLVVPVIRNCDQKGVLQ